MTATKCYASSVAECAAAAAVFHVSVDLGSVDDVQLLCCTLFYKVILASYLTTQRWASLGVPLAH